MQGLRDAVDVDEAASQLKALRRLAVQQGLLALAAAVIAASALGGSPRVAVAFGVGAVVESFLARVSVESRRDHVRELATRRAAYELPDVRRLGASLTSERQRLAMAQSIADVILESADGRSIHLLDRVASQAPLLVAIAKALADPSVRVEPVAMAILLQLLTDGHRSPLLNRQVDPRRLRTALSLIVVGIQPAPAEHQHGSVSTSRHAA